MISPYEIGFLIYKFFYLKFQKKFPYPSICTGSILIGGAGKTFLTMKIIEKLISLNKKPALIIRGYKRKLKRDLIIKGKEHSPYEIGDEAYLYLKKFKDNLIIGISKRRERIAKIIKEKFNPDIFVLDDAYQYLKYRFSLNIVVLPSKIFLKREKFFPFGKLREDYKGIKRADIIVINEKFNYMDEKDKRKIKKILKNMGFDKKIYFMRYILKGFRNLKGEKILEKNLKNKSIFAFCGIGEPQSFFELLKKRGIKVKRKKKFPDHHFYSQKEIKKILSENYNYFITTEKDSIKITTFPKNLFYPEIEVEIDEMFFKEIFNHPDLNPFQ